MSEFFKSELKDRFLQYATERDDYFEVQLLYDEFLRPNYSLEYTQKLIKEIVEFDTGLLDVMSGNGTNYFMISGTDETEDFLEEGGFTDLFIKEEEKWDSFLNHLSYNIKATSKDGAQLGKSKKNVPKKEKNLLATLVFAVAVSFIFTLYSLAKSIFTKEDYVTRQELQETLKDLNEFPQKGEISNENLSAEYVGQVPDTTNKTQHSILESE